MRTLTKEMQQAITPVQGIELLREGNRRFVNNLKLNRNLLQQVNETRSGQHPFAVIISCMDSRTSSELIFDQGLGDVFSIRIAGNIINDDILGSTEFGCHVVGAKVVLVLGHTSCGAIQGAISQVELGHLSSVTSKIRNCIPVVASRGKCHTTGDLVQGVTEENVRQGITIIRNQSPILRKMEESKEIQIIGGVYDLGSGVVSFI